MTGWAEAKLRQLQMLSREYKTFYLAEVPVGQPRARELSLQKQGYFTKIAFTAECVRALPALSEWNSAAATSSAAAAAPT